MSRTIYQILDDEYILKSFVSDLAWKRWGDAVAEDGQKGIIDAGEAAYLQLRDGRQIAEPLKAEHLPSLEEELAKYKGSGEWLRSVHERLVKTAAKGRKDPPVSESLETWLLSLQDKANKRDFGQNEVQAYSQRFCDLRNRVLNVSHCQYFVVHIPRAVPTRRVEFASVGRAMSQVFYVEALGKTLDDIMNDSKSPWDNSGLARASLYIRIADEVIAGTFRAVP